MKKEEIMTQLEEMGTEQNIKIYTRHGASAPMFGVSFGNLNKLKKKIGTNHERAIQLWESGNMDAQTLATKIANPQELSEKMAIDWISSTSYHLLIDLVVSIIVKTEYAEKLMKNWIDSEDEWKGRAGWHILAQLTKNPSRENEYFEEYILKIEKNIHNAKNRTKEAMNNALIAIGSRNEQLMKPALKAARRIGQVNIDHGKTGCKTPNADSYIQRIMNKKAT